MKDRKYPGRKGPIPFRGYGSSAEKDVCFKRRHSTDGTVIVGEDVEQHGKLKFRFRTIGNALANKKTYSGSPALGIAKAIRDALDPVRAPSKVRTLADMSEAEVAELEARLGCKVKR
jgi:hypothetical protein